MGARVLAESDLRTLPLWLMFSGEFKQRIVERIAARGVDDWQIPYHRGARAMADRDYAEAARLFEEEWQEGCPERSRRLAHARPMPGRAIVGGGSARQTDRGFAARVEREAGELALSGAEVRDRAKRLTPRPSGS